MVGKWARLGLIALGFALLASCSTVRVWEVRPEATAQALRNALGERPKGEPDAPLRYASDDTPPTPAASPALLQALARFEDASRRELWSHDEVLHVYVESMAFASEALVNSPPGDFAGAPGAGADQKLALSLYNRALDRFLRATSGHLFRPDDSWRPGSKSAAFTSSSAATANSGRRGDSTSCGLRATTWSGASITISDPTASACR